MKRPNQIKGEAEVFELITRRQPREEDIRILDAIARKLKIDFNDAFWVALVALQAYSSILTDLPRKLEQSADDLMKNARDAARIHGELVKAQMLANEASAPGASCDTPKESDRSMGRELPPNAQTAPPQETWGKLVKGAFIFMSVLLVGAAGGYWAGNQQGEQRGFKAGYSYKSDERAANVWSATPQGQLAYQMSQSGVLEMLVKCAGKGWVVINSVCTPLKVPGEGTYGWPMPMSPSLRQ